MTDYVGQLGPKYSAVNQLLMNFLNTGWEIKEVASDRIDFRKIGSIQTYRVTYTSDFRKALAREVGGSAMKLASDGNYYPVKEQALREAYKIYLQGGVVWPDPDPQPTPAPTPDPTPTEPASSNLLLWAGGAYLAYEVLKDGI